MIYKTSSSFPTNQFFPQTESEIESKTTSYGSHIPYQLIYDG
jgi:hypothetical protein